MENQPNRIYTDRIATAKIKISNSQILTITQVYFLTAVSKEWECDEIYTHINEIFGNRKYSSRHETILIGDFNSQVGERKPSENKIIGPYTITS